MNTNTDTDITTGPRYAVYGGRTQLPDGTMYLHQDEGLGVRLRAQGPVASCEWSNGGNPYRSYNDVDVYRTLQGAYIVHHKQYNNSGGRARIGITRFATLGDLLDAADDWPALRAAIAVREEWLMALPLVTC